MKSMIKYFLFSKQKISRLYYVFIGFAILTLLSWTHEKVLLSQSESVENNHQSIIAITSEVLISQHDFRKNLMLLDRDNTRDFSTRIDNLERALKNINRLREKTYTHFMSVAEVSGQGYKTGNEFKIVWNKEQEFYNRIMTLIIFGNVDETLINRFYWEEFDVLATQYWDVQNGYLQTINEVAAIKSIKLYRISLIYRISFVVVALIGFLLTHILIIKLLNPINDAFLMLKNRDLSNIKDIGTTFIETEYLFKKLHEFEQQYRNDQIYKDQVIVEKTNFLNVMSHELRTPINVIIGSVDLLKLEKEPTKMVVHIDNISHLAKNLKELVDDVLTIAKIEGNDKNRISNVKTLEFIKSISSSVKGITLGKNVLFEVFIDKNVPNSFSIDEFKLKQSLLNMITNSVKAIDKENRGYIRLRLYRHGKEINFRVFDNGCGIEKKEIARLLKPFEQVEYTLKSGTTGLGLYISTRFCESLNGSLKINSRKGLGTLATIKVPCEMSDECISMLEFDENYDSRLKAYYNKTFLGNRSKITNDDIITRSELTGSFDIYNLLLSRNNKFDNTDGSLRTELNSSNNGNLNVLVAEDYPLNQKLIKTLFESAGIKVTIASDGLEVVELYTKNRNYDFVLMDLQMPNLNGFDACKEIRKFDSNVLIIASSAHLESEVSQNLFDSGFNGFLQKPYSMGALMRIIDEYDKSRRNTLK